MQCPYCGLLETKVIDSRLMHDGEQIRRRRCCISCKERFTTYEYPMIVLPDVKKRDGSVVPFARSKLKDSLLRALQKRKVDAELIERSMICIIRKLRLRGDRVIPSQVIGDEVANTLGRIDPVAYVRFVSVYRNIASVESFKELVHDLVTNEDQVS
jgi:transcriptional repressor NrdR